LKEITQWPNATFHDMADLRRKVVLLNFWGWWCGPCRVHIPELIKLHDEFSHAGLVIISLHIDYDHKADTFNELDEMLAWDKVHQWGNRKLPYAVGLAAPNPQPYREGSKQSADTAAVRDFGVIAYPTDLLIDLEGKLRGKYSREKLPQLLKEVAVD